MVVARSTVLTLSIFASITGWSGKVGPLEFSTGARRRGMQGKLDFFARVQRGAGQGGAFYEGVLELCFGMRAAIEADLPFLAIGRGMQLLNVARGGTLVQHLPDRLGTRAISPTR